jgi:hypothetical protein
MIPTGPIIEAYLQCALFSANLAGPLFIPPAFVPAPSRLGAFGTGQARLFTGQVQSH